MRYRDFKLSTCVRNPHFWQSIDLPSAEEIHYVSDYILNSCFLRCIENLCRVPKPYLKGTVLRSFCFNTKCEKCKECPFYTKCNERGIEELLKTNYDINYNWRVFYNYMSSMVALEMREFRKNLMEV